MHRPNTRARQRESADEIRRRHRNEDFAKFEEKRRLFFVDHPHLDSETADARFREREPHDLRYNTSVDGRINQFSDVFRRTEMGPDQRQARKDREQAVRARQPDNAHEARRDPPTPKFRGNWVSDKRRAYIMDPSRRDPIDHDDIVKETNAFAEFLRKNWDNPEIKRQAGGNSIRQIADGYMATRQAMENNVTKRKKEEDDWMKMWEAREQVTRSIQKDKAALEKYRTDQAAAKQSAAQRAAEDAHAIRREREEEESIREMLEQIAENTRTAHGRVQTAKPPKVTIEDVEEAPSDRETGDWPFPLPLLDPVGLEGRQPTEKQATVHSNPRDTDDVFPTTMSKNKTNARSKRRNAREEADLRSSAGKNAAPSKFSPAVASLTAARDRESNANAVKAAEAELLAKEQKAAEITRDLLEKANEIKRNADTAHAESHGFSIFAADRAHGSISDEPVKSDDEYTTASEEDDVEVPPGSFFFESDDEVIKDATPPPPVTTPEVPPPEPSTPPATNPPPPEPSTPPATNPPPPDTPPPPPPSPVLAVGVPRVHSYTEDNYPILRRYHIGNHPLLDEHSLKTLEPTSRVKHNFREQMIVAKKGDLHEETVKQEQTKKFLDGLDKQADVYYARSFLKWLQGKSVYNHKLLTAWGTHNLFHIPGVLEYLKEATAMRHDFLHKLNILAIFQPTTLMEAELYFKYIVLHYGLVARAPGKDPEYMTIDGMLEFLDDFGLCNINDPAAGYARPYVPPDYPGLKPAPVDHHARVTPEVEPEPDDTTFASVKEEDEDEHEDENDEYASLMRKIYYDKDVSEETRALLRARADMLLKASRNR